MAAAASALPGPDVMDPAVWPLRTSADRRGRLAVGGVDLVRLADRFGTPLYVYDAATIRDAYRRYLAASPEFDILRRSALMRQHAQQVIGR